MKVVRGIPCSLEVAGRAGRHVYEPDPIGFKHLTESIAHEAQIVVSVHRIMYRKCEGRLHRLGVVDSFSEFHPWAARRKCQNTYWLRRHIMHRVARYKEFPTDEESCI